MKKISILDYGMGNIASLQNAIKKLGFKPELYSEFKSINSNIMILPGVGAFNAAMETIKKRQYNKIIKSFIKKKDNFLIGICLGMQILFTKGEENRKTEGLNIIEGNVCKIKSENRIKLPNVGLSKISVKKSDVFSFLNKYDNEKFYFVHSFVVVPNKSKNIVATSSYEGVNFSSITTNNKNVLGTQFHPEKSSKIGLNFLEDILKNFN